MNSILKRAGILCIMLITAAGCKKTEENITLTDYEGNTYKTVMLGKQLWMAENLRTTKLNDGTKLTNVTDGPQWGTQATPAYCWYNNDSASYKDIYGALYNYHAVKTKKLCPAGWHVSSDEEWASMVALFGTPGMAGDKLCEAGNLHWRFATGTDESGFSALPGGRRYVNYGLFLEMGTSAYWWTSTTQDGYHSLFRAIYTGMGVVSGFEENGVGYSIRCVRN
ncbi:MAG TPA: fibrobacter succinogenes major paralogous domain-containing protein [Bacteroidales bacterium]|nr:fibrobacter succinogenes major paralogous domain-containing protein [Bacteroidales bacterium]